MYIVPQHSVVLLMVFHKSSGLLYFNETNNEIKKTNVNFNTVQIVHLEDMRYFDNNDMLIVIILRSV